MTMTYNIALINSRNTVNIEFPNGATPHRTRRNIQQMGSRGRGRGRVGGRPGRGRIPGGRGRSGRHNPTAGITLKRQDSSFITLTDGNVIEYHPSFKFADDFFSKFQPSDKQNLFDASAVYKRSHMI